MEHEVLFSPEAVADLLNLYEYIAERSGPARAIGYVGRLEQYCLGFRFSAERGTKRDDLRPGLRTVGFERRVTIAFHVEARSVVIDRIFYAGRNVKHAFAKRRAKSRRGQRKPD